MGIQFSARIGDERARLMGFEWFGWNYGNAAAMFALLARPPMEYERGEMSIPEARRAIIWAVNTLDARGASLTRPTESHGRVVVAGLSVAGIANRLQDFREFVEAAEKAGAEAIRWS